jgi:hypothetical protein
MNSIKVHLLRQPDDAAEDQRSPRRRVVDLTVRDVQARIARGQLHGLV